MAEPNAVEHYPDTGFEDVDLNTSGAAELAKLAELADDAEASQDGLEAKDGAAVPDGETPSAPPADKPDASAESNDDSAAGHQEATTSTDQESEAGAQAGSDDSPDAAKADDSASTAGEETPVEDPMAQVKAAREALQQRLDELQVSSLADRQRLHQLEQKLATPAEPEKAKEPEGPTPEQITQQLDARITQLDTALVEAERNEPEKAPALRQQLRQVERYYNDFITQQRVAAAKGPDAQELVGQAVKASETQLSFNTTLHNVVQQYPMLDAQSEYFKEEMRDQVHEIYNPMIQAGRDPAEALAKASQMVMRANGVMSMDEYSQYQKAQTDAQTKADTDAALAAAKAAEEAKKSQAKTGDERKQEAVQRNVQAAGAAPPPLAGAGEGNKGSSGPLDKYNFADMTVEEMMKLSSDEEERIEAALELYE